MERILGMRILLSEFCCDRRQTRFPRRRRKRLLKKWARQERNYTYTPTMLQMPHSYTMVVHPSLYPALREKLLAEQQAVDARKVLYRRVWE